MTKAWWASKTVWLNVVVALIGAGEAITNGGFLVPEHAGWVLVVVGCLGVILRKLTNTAIGKVGE